MTRNLLLFLTCSLFVMGCQTNPEQSSSEPPLATLMTLDPGHFHSALVQKNMYPQVDSHAYVFAPEGGDVQSHLQRIEQYNNRPENPTHWNEVVYTGPDFAERMFREKPGNVMIVAGNNQKKTNYILRAVQEGIHVYADKPMAINGNNYETLVQAFETAEEKGLLIYDIMTERFEITTILQRRLSQFEEIFGQIAENSADNPAITKESVHHFAKMVSGSPLIRPAWFFDVEQQGAGIVDVSTHLVDLIMWSLFPEMELKPNDAEVVHARQWATDLTPDQFKKVTGLDSYPDYLQKDVIEDSKLHVLSNGEITFSIKGVYGKSSVIWDFEAPPGGMDTHFSLFRGTKSNLAIRQDASTEFVPELFVQPHGTVDRDAWESSMSSVLEQIQEEWPGIGFEYINGEFHITIPEEYRVGHEAHFTEVTEKFLEYLEKGVLPQWEKDFMITKYFITTKAYEKSLSELPQ